jgi:U3 small nucleolar ribonucleoprotein protein IMP4
MLLTTSRKPGRKTRTFAKVFASFMNWKYEQRGKSGLDFSEDRIAVIEERNGNPGLMRITTPKGSYVLEFNISNIKKMRFDPGPVVVVGNPEFAEIFEAIPERVRMNFEADKKIFVKKFYSMNILDFRYRGVSVFRLKILKMEKRA